MLWIYLGATTIVIVGSTFLAYKLAAFWGIMLEQRTLVLCAVMAMICNCVAIPSTMYFPVSHVSIIVFTAVMSTIVITYYNYCLVKKKADRKQQLYARSKTATVEVQQVQLETVVADQAAMAATEQKIVQLEPVDSPYRLPEVGFYDLAWRLPAPERSACAELLSDKPLDYLLDYAYQQGRQKQLRHSLYGLFAALDRYSDDPAALFVCIEISNIYKSFGAYHLAAVALQAAKYLPVACGNAALQRDLGEQVAYLHRLIAILQSAGMSQVPIEKVPDEWLRRADNKDVIGSMPPLLLKESNGEAI